MTRPAADMVVLMLAGAVAAVLVLSVVLIGVLELAQPGADTGGAVSAVTAMVTVLVGVVVGYLAGRRTP